MGVMVSVREISSFWTSPASALRVFIASVLTALIEVWLSKLITFPLLSTLVRLTLNTSVVSLDAELLEPPSSPFVVSLANRSLAALTDRLAAVLVSFVSTAAEASTELSTFATTAASFPLGLALVLIPMPLMVFDSTTLEVTFPDFLPANFVLLVGTGCSSWAWSVRIISASCLVSKAGRSNAFSGFPAYFARRASVSFS